METMLKFKLNFGDSRSNLFAKKFQSFNYALKINLFRAGME